MNRFRIATLALLAGAALPAPAQVVFSEIHYHPVEAPAFDAQGEPLLDLSDDVHEFVELQNAGAQPVALDGWALADGVTYAFPAGATLAPGAFCVVAKHPARLAAVYGLAPAAVFGPYAGLLGNRSDTLRLRDAAGQTVDAVTYHAHFPWAESADALGAQDRFTGLDAADHQYRGRSLQRVSVGWPSGDPANWLASPLSGPSPGAAQAVTRAAPLPVVTACAAVQAGDGAALIRSNAAVAVTCAFSATNGLGGVTLESFADDINADNEPRLRAAMTPLGGGRYTALLPARPDRTLVRYRILVDRGAGAEPVSPRADAPPLAPVGAGGAREAWHGYFVAPARAAAVPAYDVLVSSAALTRLNANITQSPRRVTAASATGLPRAEPYVAVAAPQWNGTQPAVFARGSEVWDIHLRYHGSRFHRAASNNSFKLHFPRHRPLDGQTAWFITGHGNEFIEAQRLNRLLGLPASKMFWVDWYYNGNARLARSQQGEYADELLDAYHALRQQLEPGAPLEANGELYKVVGNRDGSQNNLEGPYTRGDAAPMLANAGWSQLQRYEWTLSLQNHAWKGAKPVRDLIEGMWAARGDTPALRNFTNSPAQLASARAWFEANWDLETTLTSMALLQWMSIWDDAAQNHFFWRRADGRWCRLGWDYDNVMSQAVQNGGPNQTLYGGEYGAPTVFDGVNWWKDTFFKCWRPAFDRRVWELNNGFCDPANLAALGFARAAAFAQTRQAHVNAQVAYLGAYTKPARPVHAAPPDGAALAGPARLTTSAYLHPGGVPHAATCWELRAADGDYEEPLLRLTSDASLTDLDVPYERLAYGLTYYWRAAHIDTNGHASVVSAETRFSWGSTNAAAGAVVLNEFLADNRTAVANGGDRPDYIELRNTTDAPLSLDGYTLTDDPLQPDKYAFPAGTLLAAAGHLVVWCDDAFDAPGLHAGFALSADGEQLLLLRDGAIADSVSFGPQAADLAVGRVADGTGGWQANLPTPGAANVASALAPAAGLRLNEWMAAPAYGEDWFELYNPAPLPVALAGLHLSDSPADPTLCRLPPLAYIGPEGHLLLWADGSDAGRNRCAFKLSANGESLLLTDANGAATIDTVTFSAQSRDVAQGRLPDGGDALVAFTGQTASPGAPNWLPSPVRINEILAHADSPFEDAVELFNASPSPVDLSGWWLSDDPSLPRKYAFPPGASLPGFGYAVVYACQLAAGAVPFAFNAAGDTAALRAVDAGGAFTGYASVARFGGADANVSLGYVAAAGLGPDTGGAAYWPLAARTFGQDLPAGVDLFRTGAGLTNAKPLTGPLVINEIHYHPPDLAGGADNTALEFVELFNPSPDAVALAGWTLAGDSDLALPSDAVLAPGGYALLVGFDPDASPAASGAFRAAFGLDAATPLFGPLSAKLPNSGATLALYRPAGGAVARVPVDALAYRDLAPWPAAADGDGASLQRVSSARIGADAATWAADAPTPGAANAGVAARVAVATTSPLPGGVSGLPYAAALAAHGGAPPYVWTLLGGGAPGLGLASDGALAGVPAAGGTYTLVVAAADSAGQAATNALALTVADAPLAVLTEALPDGLYGAPYAHALAAAGGTPPYVWSLAAGAPPEGLALAADGTLSGTPAAAGAFPLTARVADGGNLSASRPLVLVIPAPPLAVATPSPLPEATLGEPYAQALSAASGTPPYAWSLTGGALPDGLALAPDGTLAGTPAAWGLFAFTARVDDHGGAFATRPLALDVVPPPLAVTSDALAGGIVGDPFAQTLAAAGGIPPYAWSLAAGALPDGLALASDGTLAGTPAAAGVFAFSLRVTDSRPVAAARDLALTVAASGPFASLSWDYTPPLAYAGVPAAVQLTARDAAGRVVTAFDEPLALAASAGAANTRSPLLITEITDEGEDQFELQNVTGDAFDAEGWFVRLGDSLTDVNTLNPVTFTLAGALPAGALVRVSEQTSSTGGRRYFGGPINWSSSAGASVKGWLMLFDAAGALRDFVAIGWSSNALATLSVEVNGTAVTPAAHWSGAPLAPGTRGSYTSTTSADSWQRVGTNDNDTASDWLWRRNDTSFNATNAALALPWPTAVAVGLSPSAVTPAAGAFVGHVTFGAAAAGVRLSAARGGDAGPSARSAPLEVLLGTDSDGDGIPDLWEQARGLTVGLHDGLLDSDADGASNLAEYLAGTDAHDPASRFAIARIERAAVGRWRLAWPAAAGILYRIHVSADLVTWTPLAPDVLPVTDGLVSVTLEAGGPVRFFRLATARE